MNSEYTLYVVDDVEAGRRVIESAFGQLYKVESFASGAACLERVAVAPPDLLLLDVDMPVMDGYTLCRQLKSLPVSSDIPAIFISGLDDLESRLSGYDAGGDDYIVKPFKIALLKQKIEVLRRIGEGKSALRSRLDESDMLASMVMSNLDEYAVLIKFLRSLNSCEQYSDLAESILAMLRSYHLVGTVQFRLPQSELTINDEGPAKPLEASILRQISTQECIVTFKSRTAFNFGRVSVLINTMPLDDPDLCGRLRDLLAIGAETLETKVKAMLAVQENSATKAEIAELLKSLDAAIREGSEKHAKARLQGADIVRQLMCKLDAEFSRLGMLESQEFAIKETLESKIDQLIEVYDFSSESEETLNSLSARLGQSLGESL
jgi:CheY-like chemotaxis protein